MTEITTTEIKILVIQILVMAILGTFMLLYSSDTTNNATNIPTSANNATSVNVNNGGTWILNLIYVPQGMGDLVFISALVISPFLLFDGFIALRFVADLVKGIL